ncbi:hypothetical protein BD309DRAFT_863723 [Dichomitus squalens]|uniref:Uncharacterized protein n=1 Tax=Dichomitus squalens (strain LYAD-421) TaxID=732165 RepID=R7T0R4_DICSQ|nr:uncharacterized protein DICSQDRAFT_180511 [Dichomitus squalens LYAD-421 SS1]EJF61818.1 hypothetical protein DICSQDRAFT_180511 [Dichomitus squalens LYAD-421 SS1]TBU43688.1 hypothetical protein BD309DRAFT_863723 [Dichomitus squalens]
MKLLTDVGLVRMPNTGRARSSARPSLRFVHAKVAALRAEDALHDETSVEDVCERELMAGGELADAFTRDQRQMRRSSVGDRGDGQKVEACRFIGAVKPGASRTCLRTFVRSFLRSPTCST